MDDKKDTASALLDSAEELVQKRGYNGFSFADLAASVGITKASIHYHFPSKGDLGRQLVSRYRQRFMAALEGIEAAKLDLRSTLRRYSDLYASVLKVDRVCLCGMMIAEFASLPPQVQSELMTFTSQNEAWLTHVLRSSSRTRPAELNNMAKYITATLEGAIIMARPSKDVAAFDAIAKQMLDAVCARCEASRT